MIVPSIDLLGGRAVQLVGGEAEALEIDAGDPRPIAERFSRVGEIAVIDLDAALGTGSNAGLIRELCRDYPCRVGGGIRDADTARRWLQDGARRVILGSAATPDVLGKLPRDRVIAALDCKNREVVVDGWKTNTRAGLFDRFRELKTFVGGFLVTTVEREGRLAGADLQLASELAAEASGCRVTLAGGITTADEIATLDRLGLDAQVGMAIYRGDLSLADAFLGPMHSDRPDGFFPTIVADELGTALGLVYSNPESVRIALDEGIGAYHSRSRGGVWRKGETSGATQRLIRIETDCDRDALRFTVQQTGDGFCHTGSATCFGDHSGFSLLAQTVAVRARSAPDGSYTKRLLDEPELLRSKIFEEAGELIDAATPGDAEWETADLLYFAMVALQARNGSLEGVVRELDRRSRLVERRPGNAKPHGAAP